MMTMRYLFASLVLALALTAAADERSGNLTAEQAFALAEAGEVTLIDIRRPDEWRQTGVAKGVRTINMLHPQGMPGFAREVYAAVGNDLDAPIVLICRTGNRTSRLQPILTEMGFTNVRHVPEGMVGSRSGPGWIARGLPVEACQIC
ncbi:MAG TPA: rhodanese-like domain-containing protein [Azoarcus taiwanensis]|nr:rhodanese-like domain-containing protein [Azoarcus taiwanensis]